MGLELLVTGPLKNDEHVRRPCQEQTDKGFPRKRFSQNLRINRLRRHSGQRTPLCISCPNSKPAHTEREYVNFQEVTLAIMNLRHAPAVRAALKRLGKAWQGLLVLLNITFSTKAVADDVKEW